MLNQKIPTRFGLLSWHDQAADHWILHGDDHPYNAHAAAIFIRDCRVVVFLPEGVWPGGFRLSLDRVVPGANIDQLVEVAVTELIMIGTVDPIEWAAQCAE